MTYLSGSLLNKLNVAMVSAHITAFSVDHLRSYLRNFKTNIKV